MIGEVRFGNLTQSRSSRDGTWFIRKQVGHGHIDIEGVP